MTIEAYFAHLRLPPKFSCRTLCLGGWNVHELCLGNGREFSTTVADVNALNGNDKKSFVIAYTKLLTRTDAGQPLANIFTGQQLHIGHKFKRPKCDQDITVWRIWNAGVIRIYFVYVGEKSIVILRTWPKREDRLNAGEKKELEQLSLLVLDLNKEEFDNRIIVDKDE